MRDRFDGVVVLERRRTVSVGVLLVAAFGAFLAFLDSTIVNVAFPDLLADFSDSTYASLSWVLNAYNIVFAALLVTAGRFADLLGRKRMFVFGVLVFTVASALIAAAPSLRLLVAARCLQAVGAAILVPASLALVIDAFPGDRRSHAIGLWGAAAAVAAGLGPPIGGVLVDASGWRLAFLVNVPMGVAALLVSRVTLVESRAPGRRRLPDLLGAALLAGSLGALTTALVQGETWGWGSARVVGFALAAALLLAAFAAQSRRHPSPVLDPALLRLPGFAPALVLTAVAGMGFYAYLLTHILWLKAVWGYSITAAGLAVMPGALIAAVVAGTVGKVADKRGARVLVVPGAALWALSFGWYLTVVSDTPHLWSQWMPGQVLSGIGVGLTLPTLGSAAVAAVPGGRYATASALSSSVRQLGAVLGISILVIILGAPRPGPGLRDALHHGWTFSAICFAAVALGALGLRRPHAVQEDVVDDLAPLATARANAVPAPPPATPPAVDARTNLELLRAVPVFAPLPPQVCSTLARAARVVSLGAGEVLFEQGATADSLYVVRSGRLVVERDGVVVDEVARGGVVGELGVLTGGARSATVRARRDSELLRVTRRSFRSAVGGDASSATALATDLARRLQAGGGAAPRGSRLPTLVAVAPATDGSTPAGYLADHLSAALTAQLRVPVCTGADIREIERLEREHDLVLLVATAAGAWRELCLRQADRVVLVAGTGDEPAGQPPPGGADVDLVLLGPPPGRERLDRWQHALDPRTTVTAALDPAEVQALAQRLADRLSGRSVGLVLSGGGARALAHIGVLAELEAAGVVIGQIAGASMGAYIGALAAMGLSAAQVDARLYEEYVRRNPVGDYTVPRHALTSGRRGYAMLQRSFGDLDAEALPIGLTTTTVDLYERELVVLRRGRVRDLVAASMALPGISPPHELDGRMLVDGGVLDNSPVAALRERAEGPVLLVSVLDPGGGPGAPRRSGPPRRPPVMETLLRAMTTGSAQSTRTAHEEATLVISPSARGVGLLEFHQIDRMIEGGRLAAREALAAAPPGLLPQTIGPSPGSS